MHVTRPYHTEGTSMEPHASLVLPMFDTQRGDFLGETAVHFSLESAATFLSNEGTPMGVGSMYTMCQVNKLWDETEAFLGPNMPIGSKTVPLPKALMPEDSCDELFEYPEGCANFDTFNIIHNDMSVGNTAIRSFKRTSPTDATSQEWVSISYDTPTIGFKVPIDPSDFSRGVKHETVLLYALGLGQTEEGLSQTFDTLTAATHRALSLFVIVLIVISVVALTVVLLVSAWISRLLTIPVAQLRRLIANMHRYESTEDLPTVVERCREVTRVRSTFEHLFKLVRVANMAFFLGDVDKAYTTLNESLELFTKLDNRKSIGIANNNLGNVMLTMYRVMKATSTPALSGMSQPKVIEKGCEYFRSAIEMGEEALRRINDDEGFSVNYLIFMQQLSNRYFNRALFLLTSKADHPDPQGAENQGLTDLTTCRDMDREVVDNGDQVGYKGDKQEYFELLMGRITGLLRLMKMGYEDIWGIEDLFDDASAELEKALGSPNHDLFRELDAPGQMQRLDAALVDYHLLMSENEAEDKKDSHIRVAGQVAVRMMIEDEYLIGECGLMAVKALVATTMICGKEHYGGEDPSDIRSSLFNYRHVITETLSLSYSSSDLVAREYLNACTIGDFAMESF